MKRALVLVATTLLTVSCGSSSADKLEEPVKIAQNPASQTQPQSEIYIAYPSSAKIPAATSFIAGAIPAGSTLTCNDASVQVSPHGFFATVVKLAPGRNSFVLKSSPSGAVREVIAEREMPDPGLDANTLKIEKPQPASDRGITSGDILELSVHATPGSEVEAIFGKRNIFLRPAQAVSNAAIRNRHSNKKSVKANLVSTSSVNSGLDAAYGKIYQRRAHSPADLYVGFYKIQPDDNFQNTKIKYVLHHDGKQASISGTANVTVVSQPSLAETIQDKTIVRVGPGAGRITPLPRGVRLLVDGWVGDEVRCIYSPTKHTWIKRDALNFESSGLSGAAPQATARTINVGEDEYGTTITIPLSQRVPFQIEQQLKPNTLVLRVFGVTGETDWITNGDTNDKSMVENVTWKEAADGVYEVTAHLKSGRQWGFKGDYDDTNLVLHVKNPPRFKRPAPSLEGLSICVDPGHGGSETGAIGCSGVHEAMINLGIGLKLQKLLQAAGANVTMTRTTDRVVSLDERVEIAERAKVDLLLSVHNNSLPDGRDPMTEHGTSTYWYHPQAVRLAKVVNDGMVKEVGFPDYHSRFQNLALTRPSAMVSMLAEVGFVINPDEYAFLISEEGQQRAAQGLFNGLLNYLRPTPAPQSH